LTGILMQEHEQALVDAIARLADAGKVVINMFTF
jgi:hypothetical protein